MVTKKGYVAEFMDSAYRMYHENTEQITYMWATGQDKNKELTALAKYHGVKKKDIVTYIEEHE